MLENQVKHLRQFVTHMSRDLDQFKHKDFRETKFWKELGDSKSLIQDSEPPMDFPPPYELPTEKDKNAIILR